MSTAVAAPSIEILSVSPFRPDHAAVRQVLSGASDRVVVAKTCRQARRRLIRGGIGVVVCERDLPDGTWREILDCTQACSDQPLLIVTSRAADSYLWAEVLNLGGFDLIEKPFCASELQHVLETARQHTQQRRAAGGPGRVKVKAALESPLCVRGPVPAAV